MKILIIILLLLIPIQLCAIPVSGLSFWLKADSISATNGQAISQWNDSSANAFHVTQSNTSQRPVYVTNAVNGLPVVRFDGDDILTRTGVLGSSLTGSNQATIFIIQRQNGSDARTTTFAWGRHISVSDDQRLLFHLTYDDIVAFQHGNPNPVASGGKGEGIGVIQPANWDNVYHMAEGYRNGSTSYIKVDNNTLISTNSFPGSLDTSIIAPIYVGGDNFGNVFTGEIAEIVIYNRALSSAEELQVADYLSVKYFNTAIIPEPSTICACLTALCLLAMGCKAKSIL